MRKKIIDMDMRESENKYRWEKEEKERKNSINRWERK